MMVTCGENFSSIGPVLDTKTLVPMKNVFAKKKGSRVQRKKNRSNTCPLIFRALSLVKISTQSDLPFSSSGKVKKEGGGTLNGNVTSESNTTGERETDAVVDVDS